MTPCPTQRPAGTPSSTPLSVGGSANWNGSPDTNHGPNMLPIPDEGRCRSPDHLLGQQLSASTEQCRERRDPNAHPSGSASASVESGKSPPRRGPVRLTCYP